jgi:hypothetical protein
MKNIIAGTLFALISAVNLSTAVVVIHQHHGRTPSTIADPNYAMPVPIDLGAYLGAK